MKTNNLLKQLMTVVTVATLLTGCASSQASSNVSSTSEPKETEVAYVSPVITLSDDIKDDTVTLTVGDELDVSNLIKTIKVGGEELKLSDDGKLTNGTYIIDDSKVDTSKAGTYKITISAKSEDGEEVVNKTLNVTVEEKETTSTTKSDSTSKKSSNSKKSTTSSSSKKSSSSKTTTSSKSSNASSSNKSSASSNSSSGKTNSSSSSSSSSSNSGSSSNNNTATTHTHNWVEKTRTITHPAEYKDVWHEAVWGPVAVERNNGAYQCHCGEIFCTHEEMGTHLTVVHDLVGNYYTTTTAACGTHIEYQDQVIQDGYYEKVLVKDAYDETYVWGRQCSTCGEKEYY